MLRKNCKLVKLQKVLPTTIVGWIPLLGQLLLLTVCFYLILFLLPSSLRFLLAGLCLTLGITYAAIWLPGRVVIWAWIGQLFAISIWTPSRSIDYEVLCPAHVIALQTFLTVSAVVIPPMVLYAWTRENKYSGLVIFAILLIGLIILRYATMISATTCVHGGGYLEPDEIGILGQYTWYYWIIRGEVGDWSVSVIFKISWALGWYTLAIISYFSLLFRMAGFIKRRFVLK